MDRATAGRVAADRQLLERANILIRADLPFVAGLATCAAAIGAAAGTTVASEERPGAQATKDACDARRVERVPQK